MNQDGRIEGIITKGVGGIYTVRISDDSGVRKVYCSVRGIFRQKDLVPQAGDTVYIEESGDVDVPYVISAFGERRNSLMRPPLANVDYLLLTFSVIEPVPDLKLLDKMLIISGVLGIKPVIIFTKSDLGQAEAETLSGIYKAAGFDVMISSPENPVSKETLMALTGSGISAFAGPSGVGKSSLCNRILGTRAMETNEISVKLKRGRHTTRHCELHDFGDGFITDTPGFTSLSLFELGISHKDVCKGYPEIMKHASDCRYDDCGHVGEDGCAVDEAFQKSMIDEGRMQRYREFYKELYDNRNNYKRRKRK